MVKPLHSEAGVAYKQIVPMCRIFAFRSRVSLKVQRSLVKAENALRLQSELHPHGWGIAYYLTDEKQPQQVKSVESAFTDERFERVAGFLTSHAVVAHVRKATVGELGITNTHPFHWNGWSFCHNGTIFGFGQLRERILERIAPRFRKQIRGTTDSESLFYLLLTTMEEAGCNLDEPGETLPAVLDEKLGELLGWLRDEGLATGADAREPMMSFVLTNGRLMLANRFNGSLYFSTQKVRCADFDVCPIADKVCHGPRQIGIRHTHFLIASDPTSKDDVWEEIPNRHVAIVDGQLALRIADLGLDGPPVWYASTRDDPALRVLN